MANRRCLAALVVAAVQVDACSSGPNAGSASGPTSQLADSTQFANTSGGVAVDPAAFGLPDADGTLPPSQAVGASTHGTDGVWETPPALCDTRQTCDVDVPEFEGVIGELPDIDAVPVDCGPLPPCKVWKDGGANCELEPDPAKPDCCDLEGTTIQCKSASPTCMWSVCVEQDGKSWSKYVSLCLCVGCADDSSCADDKVCTEDFCDEALCGTCVHKAIPGCVE